jgi:hypothetical protein
MYKFVTRIRVDCPKGKEEALKDKFLRELFKCNFKPYWFETDTSGKDVTIFVLYEIYAKTEAEVEIIAKKEIIEKKMRPCMREFKARIPWSKLGILIRKRGKV